jgi:hypothetical protein
MAAHKLTGALTVVKLVRDPKNATKMLDTGIRKNARQSAFFLTIFLA